MVQSGNIKKPLHQQFSEVDNEVFSAFCNSFSGVQWVADFKDSTDLFCGIDLQLTAKTPTKINTYDIELKAVFLRKLLDYCYFQTEKWYNLVEFDNDKKLYVVIYPLHDIIAIWNVTGALLRSSEKDIKPMKKNTASGSENVEKQVYKFKLKDAKVFKYNLSQYREKYNALYKAITQKEIH